MRDTQRVIKEEDLITNSNVDASVGLGERACQSLLSLLSVTQEQLQQLSPVALAYLGDAVYELCVRSYYLLPPKRSHDYHNLVVAQVRAETQASHLRFLTPHLNSKELEIVRRGRNAATGRPRKVAPEIYQQATSLEALVGYLYLTDCRRLCHLLQQLKFEPGLEE